jgi:hypothetical protein
MVLLLILLLAANLQAATTYYVSNSGSNGNNGTSAPFQTITYALTKATNSGDVIIVKPGRYTDYESGWGLHLRANNSGITLQSEVPGQAIIDFQNISDAHDGVYIEASNVTIKGFKITNGWLGGISIFGNNNKIIGNEVYNNGTRADTNFGQDGIDSEEGTSGNTYIGNYVHHNGRPTSNPTARGDHGFYLSGSNELIINNISTNHPGRGIQIAGYGNGSYNSKVYNNVFAFNTLSGMVIYEHVENLEVKNNIFYKNGTYGVETSYSRGTPVIVENNIIYGNTSASTYLYVGQTVSLSLKNNLFVNPLFVSESNFHLQSSTTTNSPAINAGQPLSQVTTDYDGNPRSGNPDIGAFEYLSGGSPAGIKPATPSNLEVH